MALHFPPRDGTPPQNGPETTPKAPAPEKGKNGRPPVQISPKEFESLCVLQCTKVEICGFFGVDQKTLTAWCQRTYGMGFSQVYKQKRQSGYCSLRRFQFKLAERDSKMAIWLGKQWLGQKEPEKAQEEKATEGVKIIDDL